MYENSITNLVSHGYVVVGINNLFINGYTALENGHIVSVTTDYSIQTKLNMRVYLQKNGEFIYNKIFRNRYHEAILTNPPTKINLFTL